MDAEDEGLGGGPVDPLVQAVREDRATARCERRGNTTWQKGCT